MRTKEQIKTEIQALKALKPIGPFALKTGRKIRCAIVELEDGFDQTSGEFEELSDEEQEAVRMAHDWKEGDSDERYSEGWGSLVEKS